ncbi:hypothetical protein D9757_003173 [Collybiopsis confluens]|uniref:Uncharacterized protein n=1 Tax=Collybiopsis confluens TaxID=2823264 RepID=A0A8H5MEP4_9AGAR|nr:hypothetical protein D9757_003173 [Collybiopsis confluens]
MTSDSSPSTSPPVLTPESTGSIGNAGSSPDTSVASKKSRRQTAFYPSSNLSNKPQKPFSRRPLDKPHYGLVPAIGSSVHSPNNSSITSISDLQLPPTPIAPDSRPVFAPHIKSKEIDLETLLPGVVDDLAAVSRAWCIDLDPSQYSQDSPIDVLDVLQTTTRAIRSTRNYLLAQPDESAGIIREHYRDNRLGSRGGAPSSKGEKSHSEPDPLTLIRRSALEVLAVLRELEERTRLPLSDDAYDAQSDGGGSHRGGGSTHARASSPEHEEEEDAELTTGAGIHEVDKDTSVAFSLVQVNGRFESVPVWEDPDDESFFVDDGAAKEKKDRWDELVLGSGWLYKQDVTLAQLSNERKLVGEYLDVVDEALFEGKRGARSEQRGWEKEKRKISDRERSRSSAKRRVSAGDAEGKSFGIGLGLSSGSGSRRVSTGMLPDTLGRMNLSEEPQQMEGISEEAENQNTEDIPEENEEEDSELEDSALPEWAKRHALLDNDLDRAHGLIAVLLPANLLRHLPTEPPSSSAAAHAAFLDSLSSGQLLCVAYNTGVRKSKKPWGYINKDGIHDIIELQKTEEKKSDESKKTGGWTFRRSDNLRLWVGALKLRYLLPILVPSQVLSPPKPGAGTPMASNTPLTSPLPIAQKFPTNEPPVMFDARIVAKQEEGWEEMLETYFAYWIFFMPSYFVNNYGLRPEPASSTPPSPNMSSAESSAATLVERVQNFVSENKQAILIGTAAAAIAVGGVAYYASSSSRPSTDLEKGEKKEKKKENKSSKKKKKTVNDSDGPVLEERKPKAKVEDDDVELLQYTAESVAALPESERSRIAGVFKAKGNEAYKARDFAAAAKLYSHAIEITTKAEPVFYSNRAACYMNMVPPQYELVVQDCDEAIKLDPSYVKALNRRAMACEHLERYSEALRDFTATTILEKFTNQASQVAVERVLKSMATKRAQEILSARGPRLPPPTFISAYFAAFRPRPHPTLFENPTTGDRNLLQSFEAIDASDYSRAFSLVKEALEQDISWDMGKAEALNLRGTFKFLIGDVEGAKQDLNESLKIAPSFTQSLVKIASVYMEQSDSDKAFECFEEAIKHNPNDPDIYYHRGQVLFIMNKFDEAAENYTNSTRLDDQFVFSHIQLAVAQYKAGNLANAMAQFRRTMVAFPQKSEPLNYYGELLLDQMHFQDAIEKFDKAYEIEKTKSPPNINVLPLVNKGLAMFQMDQNVGSAERCCNEALRLDPECEAAVATLAQLSLQQGRIDKAVEYFEKQANLARTEPELVNALNYQFATEAQIDFAKNYPQMAAQMSAMAQAF